MLPALLALALPCLLAGQNPWLLAGNNNAAATSFLGTTNAQPLRLGTQAANQPIRIFTGGIAAANERMTILGNGNIGIGSNNPSYRLHVINSGNSRTGYFSNTFVSSTSTFGIYSETTNTGTGSESAGFFRAQGTSGTNIGLDADARNGATNYGMRSTVVGAATSTNYGLHTTLTPSTGANNFGIYSTITGTATNPATNHFSGYFNNGKVYVGYRLGVGVTNPSERLHVGGNMLLDGFLRLQAPNNHTFTIQTENDGDIHFIGDGVNRMTISDQLGRVGIGDIVPLEKLHVAGNMLLDGFLRLQAPNNHTFTIQTENNGDIHFIGDGVNRMTIRDDNGFVGIGTSAPASKLDVRGNLTLGNAGDNSNITLNAANNKTASIGVQDDDNSGFYISTNGAYRLRVNQNGNVAIGLVNAPANYRLSVDGRVIAEEVRVELSGNWGDYVFNPEYHLQPLNEVKSYVQSNRHLPGIPSATEVEEKGLHLGDMQTKMMVKLEELYLHVIRMNERVEVLEKENEALLEVLSRKN
jgi:hypothetical protein